MRFEIIEKQMNNRRPKIRIVIRKSELIINIEQCHLLYIDGRNCKNKLNQAICELLDYYINT